MAIAPQLSFETVRRSLIAGMLASTSGLACACPFDPRDPLLDLRATSDRTVVRITTQGPGACTNVGTGFFFSAKGHILTAGHIIPPDCDNDKTAVEVRWNPPNNPRELVGPFEAKVVGRSSLDVVVLALSDPPDDSRQYLKQRPINESADSLKNSCILLASHYSEQTDIYSSFAEIASVALDGDDRWALSGEGFNASRSGSPIILRSGQVAAIFVARPVNKDDRSDIIFSRAYVLPLNNIPGKEIDLAAVAASPGNLQPFLTTLATPKPAVVWTSFGLSVTEQGFRTDENLPTYFITRNGELRKAPDSLWLAGMQALAEGHSIVRKVAVTREFKADPGFVFDPSTFRYDASALKSLNPTQTPLPTTLCSGGSKHDCVDLSADRRTMRLYFSLYPGVDGRRSWIDAEVQIQQRPL